MHDLLDDVCFHSVPFDEECDICEAEFSASEGDEGDPDFSDDDDVDYGDDDDSEEEDAEGDNDDEDDAADAEDDGD